jgi:hypothetical protein
LQNATDITVFSSTNKPYCHVEEEYGCMIPGDPPSSHVLEAASPVVHQPHCCLPYGMKNDRRNGVKGFHSIQAAFK